VAWRAAGARRPEAATSERSDGHKKSSRRRRSQGGRIDRLLFSSGDGTGKKRARKRVRRGKNPVRRGAPAAALFLAPTRWPSGLHFVPTASSSPLVSSPLPTPASALRPLRDRQLLEGCSGVGGVALAHALAFCCCFAGAQGEEPVSRVSVRFGGCADSEIRRWLVFR
jgi:hypothetical protein